MSDDIVRDMVEEFFTAPTVPANTHEEWLLRMCAQLMDREARVVSVLETQTSTRRPRRPPKWKASSTDSGGSTAQSTATGGTSWGES